MSNQQQTANSFHIMQEISRLNNEGLLLMARGQSDNGKALRTFRHALALINRYHNVDGIPMNDIAAAKQHPNSPTMIQAALLASSGPVPGLHDECFYIHNHALWLDPTVLLSDPVNMYSLASTAVLFNLGLACHQYGIRYQDESKLQSACRVYELCSRLAARGDDAQEHQQQLLGSAYPEFTRVLGWAALNNQGQLMYRSLGEQARATELLHSQLGPAFAGADDFAPSNFLGSHHLDEIILNIVVASRTGMALVASPAA